MFNQRENLCYVETITYFKQIEPEFQDLTPLVCKNFWVNFSGSWIISYDKIWNYKIFVDKLDMNKIANDFMSRCPRHKSTFEKVWITLVSLLK